MNIASWEQILKLQSEFPDNLEKPANVFRGQSNSDWKLHPSITRLCLENKLNEKKSIDFETKILIWFKLENSKSILLPIKPKENDLLGWWENMQHYRLPTRLLDWTKSLKIAAYFACSSNLQNDGVIYSLDAGWSDWIQSRRKNLDLSQGVKSALDEISNSRLGNPFEKSFILISNPNPTSRMRSQKSQLSITTEILVDQGKYANDIVFKNVINGQGKSIFNKWIIPKQMKQEILYELAKENIDESTIYPDNDFINEVKDDFESFIKNNQ